jgi:hypothetical protein
MANRLSRSHQELDFESIANDYNLFKKSLDLFYSKNNHDFQNFFSNYSENEILNEYNLKSSELDKLFVLTLLSAIEAKFKIDYSIRCENRYKDEISQIFREYYRENSYRVNFEEKILKTWKDKSAKSNVFFNEIIQIFKFRHWLAHGRYWILKSNIEKYDFFYIYAIAQSIDSDLNLYC